jgi:tetratricopeptide (TPR) repeat protein
MADSGRAETERAIALDSTAPQAWVQRGLLTMYLDDDWPSARRDLSTAVRLGPDHPPGHQYYAIYLGELEGQLDSAIVHARRAAELDPAYLLFKNTLGDLFMRARRYDSAIAMLRQAVSLDPAIPGPWTRLIQSYERSGRFAEAIQARRQAPDTTGAGVFAQAFAAGGEAGYRRVLDADVRRRIDSLTAAMQGPRNEVADTVPPLREGRIALLYAQLGEWAKAMDWVLRDHGRRPKRFRWFVAHPEMEGLRNDPRFLPLVRQEGLEALLRQ